MYLNCPEIAAVGIQYGSRRIVCDMFDTTTQTWSRMPNMRRKRESCAGMIVTQRGTDNFIYVFGGHNNDVMLDSCEFLDVGKRKWTLLKTNMAMARTNACVVLLDHTTAVICGGWDGRNELTTCESIDLTTHTFSSFPDMMEIRAGHVGVHYDDTIVVIGGSIEKRTCEKFDKELSMWIRFASLNEGRDVLGAAVIGDKIYAVGGNFMNSMEVYDGVLWLVLATVPYPFCTAAAFGRSIVVCDVRKQTVNAFNTDTHEWVDLPNANRLKWGYTAAVSF